MIFFSKGSLTTKHSLSDLNGALQLRDSDNCVAITGTFKDGRCE
jgi:hypothetical protein